MWSEGKKQQVYAPPSPLSPPPAISDVFLLERCLLNDDALVCSSPSSSSSSPATAKVVAWITVMQGKRQTQSL